MAEDMRTDEAGQDTSLQLALAVLSGQAADLSNVQAKLARSQTGWLVARPVERMQLCRSLPEKPNVYSVIATDGSQIEPDRHGPVLCCLINIGTAVLRYGPNPRAELSSDPRLYYKDEDLYLSAKNRQILMDGSILGVKRHVAELERLVDFAQVDCSEQPLIGLQDGSFILWSLWALEGRSGLEPFRMSLLKQFVASLERLRSLSVPIASYISRPRATDVVSVLRVILCPYPVADCDQYCAESSLQAKEPCAGLAKLADRWLFRHLLSASGDRSAIFMSSSSVSLDYYAANRVYFFYLNVGQEIARVEIPEWVALDAGKLDLVHGTIYDQCLRGGGYPRALIEAHEKAVIGASDRLYFQEMVDRALIHEGIRRRVSEKARSKRLRAI